MCCFLHLQRSFDDIVSICLAGFDVDGKIQSKVEFNKDPSNRDSTTFEFFVNRAGDDPMVTMNVTVKAEYGQHGCSETFEVTLTDKKSIKYEGW